MSWASQSNSPLPCLSNLSLELENPSPASQGRGRVENGSSPSPLSTPPMATFFCDTSYLPLPAPSLHVHQDVRAATTASQSLFPTLGLASPQPGQLAHWPTTSGRVFQNPIHLGVVAGSGISEVSHGLRSQQAAGHSQNESPQRQPLFQQDCLSAGSCGFSSEHSRRKSPPWQGCHHPPPTSEAGASSFPILGFSHHHLSPYATT